MEGWRPDRHDTALRLRVAPRPPGPHRSAHHPLLLRPARGWRPRPFRARLLLAGAKSQRDECLLRGDQGCGGELDPRPRRLVQGDERDGERHRGQRDPHPAHARGEPREGVPHLHLGRGPCRRDPLRRRRLRRENERQAAGTASVSDSHPRGFASDNNSGAHPEILAAIAAANEGHVVAYGDDDFTAAARERFREQFGEAAEPFLVFNGTGANVSSIDALTAPHEAIICTDVAHMNVDECGAPERVAQTKLLTVANKGGKLTPEDVRRWEAHRGDEHAVQPRVVSITQASEVGTVYTIEETRAIADAAHELGMYVHVDGARVANAAVSQGVELREITTDAGVDVISFGGTKNGLLMGEAVVFLPPELGEQFLFTRKQLGQLASKMRFIAAQLEALLTDDLWRRYASNANSMARRLA